jgi:hypothetical protein
VQIQGSERLHASWNSRTRQSPRSVK